MRRLLFLACDWRCRGYFGRRGVGLVSLLRVVGLRYIWLGM